MLPRESNTTIFVSLELSKTLKGVRKDLSLCMCKLFVLRFSPVDPLTVCDRDMVAQSGRLVSAAEDALLAAVSKARDPFNDALERLYEAYKTVRNLILYVAQLHNLFIRSTFRWTLCGDDPNQRAPFSNHSCSINI